MIDKRNIFDPPPKNDLRIYENIRKITTGHGHYTTGYYKLIAIDISKQQALNTDTKAIQQINLTGNLEEDGNRTIFFVNDKAKETILNF